MKLYLSIAKEKRDNIWGEAWKPNTPLLFLCARDLLLNTSQEQSELRTLSKLLYCPPQIIPSI